MNPSLIPSQLLYLIPMVEKWGLSDYGSRDEQLFDASKSDLKAIIDSLPDDKLHLLNEWLVADAEDKVKSMTDEYVNFTCYVMAFDMARALLESDR